jgi:hypothetical protein
MGNRYGDDEHWTAYFSMYVGIFITLPSPLVMKLLFNFATSLGGRWEGVMRWYWYGGELPVILAFIAFFGAIVLLLGVIGLAQAKWNSSVATTGILLGLLALGQAIYYAYFAFPARIW